jgi:hypothetical protein
MPSKISFVKQMYILFANTINEVYRCKTPGYFLEDMFAIPFQCIVQVFFCL